MDILFWRGTNRSGVFQSLVVVLALLILFLVLLPKIYAKTNSNYPVVSGSDVSGGGTGASFTIADIDELNTSGSPLIESKNNWPSSNQYDESRYLEFVFSPNIPSSAIIKNVSIINIYQQIGKEGAKLSKAKLEIFSGNTLVKSKEISVDANQSKFDVLELNTPALINGLKIKFLAYSDGVLIKTNYDFIGVTVEYQLPLVVKDKSITTNEDVATTTILTITDPEMKRDGSIIYSTTTNPSNGIITLSGNKITYTPNKNYNGTDSLKFKANDGSIDSNEATISITISPVNNAPILQNITSTSTNELTEFKFTATSTDPDGDAITYSLTPTTTGAVINANTGEFKWTPTEEQGPSTHTFTITVKDTSNATTSQSFTITVNEVNSAPTVPNITLVTDKNISTTTTLLATDSDIPANTIKFATTSNPSNGTATISNNKLTYTPNFNFIGTDIITYKANDGATSSNIATITVTVNQKNNSPVLQNITSTSTNELTEFKFTATSTDPDGDAITYSLTPTTTGAVINANTGEFKWTPTEEQGPSTHTFTITVKDTSNATTSQSFTITVNEVNSAPTVPNITLVTDKNISTTTTLLATDSDIPANTIKFATTSNPSNGTATISNNKLTYTPNFNFIGTDIITYKANDGATSSNIATITVTVNQKNVPPIAQNINATTSEETFVAIILKATDSDVPADILTYSLTSNPSHGILSLNNSTTIYTPEINYYGTDSFTYKANDGTGDSNIATVTITISNINDAPTTNNKSVNATVDNSIIIAVPVSDPDPNNTFTTSVVNSPSLGSITAINGLNITYKPTGPVGTDTFTFKVNDGEFDSNIATTTVTLTHGATTQIIISATPTILDVGSSSVIMVSVRDKFNNIVSSDNSSQIELRAEADRADREVIMDPSLLTLSNGIATTTITKNSSGDVKITAVKEGFKKVQTTVSFIKFKIKNINQTKIHAKGDDTYKNGWQWILDITAPLNETGLSMKFSDWFNGTSIIPISSNMQFYSAQSSNAFDENTSIGISSPNTYSNIMILNKDIDPATIGRQIQIYVNAKIPKDKKELSGEFSILYKILTEEFSVLKTLLE